VSEDCYIGNVGAVRSLKDQVLQGTAGLVGALLVVEVVEDTAS
jgi:hypothetical protein